MPTPTLLELRDGFADLASGDWQALLVSLRAGVRAGAANPRDLVTLASAFWRSQLHSPVSDPGEREKAGRLLRLLRDRRGELVDVAAAVLAEQPTRRPARGF